MSKRIRIAAAIIVALIAIGATATYITIRQRGKEVKRPEEVATIHEVPEESVIQPEEPVIQPEEPAPSEPIDNSNWKTYRNEEYGFELSYPKGLLFEDRGFATKKTSTRLIDFCDEIIYPVGGFSGCGLLIGYLLISPFEQDVYLEICLTNRIEKAAHYFQRNTRK